MPRQAWRVPVEEGEAHATRTPAPAPPDTYRRLQHLRVRVMGTPKAPRASPPRPSQRPPGKERVFKRVLRALGLVAAPAKSLREGLKIRAENRDPLMESQRQRPGPMSGASKHLTRQ